MFIQNNFLFKNQTDFFPLFLQSFISDRIYILFKKEEEEKKSSQSSMVWSQEGMVEYDNTTKSVVAFLVTIHVAKTHS